MQMITSGRSSRWTHAKGLVGALAATASLAGGAQALAPASAAAEMSNDVAIQCDWLDIQCLLDATSAGGGSTTGTGSQPSGGGGKPVGDPTQPTLVDLPESGYTIEVIPIAIINETGDIDDEGTPSTRRKLKGRQARSHKGEGKGRGGAHGGK